jgi:DNA-binding HxlR family transcriptional regulator
MLNKPPISNSVTRDTGNRSSGKERFPRSLCPITNGLDIFGDKWTLLIIRDLMLGKCRYQDLLSSPEHVASNILADRLRKMESVGLVSRRAYQQKPARYEYFLTEKGTDLAPILEAMVQWGKRYYPDTTLFSRFERKEQDKRS